jgi:mannitol 2-dehydrogenase
MTPPALPPARRLSRSQSIASRPGLSLPSYDGKRLRPGVIHVGVGRFHRAHQACYFDAIAERRISDRWGVVGAGMLSVRTQLTLAAQDHLFTILIRDSEEGRARVVGSHQDFIFAPRERARLLHRMAHQDTQVVTLTVTADAYGTPLGTATNPSVFDLVARALDRRRRAGGSPFTVMSCDNVADNGVATAAAVQTAAERWGGPGLAAWIARHVAFPATMVDRITAPADDAALEHVRLHFGIDDPYLAVTEPFSQWVVEDRFSSERPPLEDVGAQFVTDVRPFRQVKGRLLNAAHCAVGYLGSLAGHETASEVMEDEVLRPFIEDLMREVAPLLPTLPGWDLEQYQRSISQRLGNPGLRDPLSRLTRRGSVRMPGYVQPSLAEAVQQGHDHRHLALVVAAWAVHLRDTPVHRLDDPLAAELHALATTDLAALLTHAAVLGPLAENAFVAAMVASAVNALDRLGVRGALAAQSHGRERVRTSMSAPAYPFAAPPLAGSEQRRAV